jgi:hypothetical protein
MRVVIAILAWRSASVVGWYLTYCFADQPEKHRPCSLEGGHL